MKAFLAAIAAAVILSVGAAALLNDRFQRDSATAFTTSGVRL